MNKYKYLIFILLLIPKCGYRTSSNVKQPQKYSYNHKIFEYDTLTSDPIFENKDYIKWREFILKKFYWQVLDCSDFGQRLRYLKKLGITLTSDNYKRLSTLKRYTILKNGFNLMNKDSWEQFLITSFAVIEKLKMSLISSDKHKVYYNQFLELFNKVMMGASENLNYLSPLLDALLDNFYSYNFDHELIYKFKNFPELFFVFLKEQLIQFDNYRHSTIINFKKNKV